MNIAFITPQLKIGGYEKVVVNYANAFCTLVLCQDLVQVKMRFSSS